MKIRTKLSTLLAFATLCGATFCGLTGSVSAQQTPPSAPDNDFILRAAVEELAGILDRHGLAEVGHLGPAPNGDEVRVVRAAASVDPVQILSDVTTTEPSVTNMEEMLLASLPELANGVTLDDNAADVLGALGDSTVVPFDRTAAGTERSVWAGYVEQPAAALVRASQARALEKGSGQVVAIIDSGIDTQHPLFDGHLVPGYDFILDSTVDDGEWHALDESSIAILGESSIAILGSEDVVVINESSIAILGDQQVAQLDPTKVPDSFGHGTMVAGIVHLVAPEAKIMPLRVFDGAGYASIVDIVRAIYFAVDNGATVINMSFSFSGFSPELSNAVQYALNNGVQCVASVGNGGQSGVIYPASSLGVFGVAASDSADEVSSFSNYGWLLATVAAPGEQIITAYPGGGWAAATGTSFAAPFVSGALALLVNQEGGLPGDLSVLEALDALSATDPLYGANSSSILHGRLNIESALSSSTSTTSGGGGSSDDDEDDDD